MKKFTSAALTLLLTFLTTSIAYCAQGIQAQATSPSGVVKQERNLQLKTLPKIFRANVSKQKVSPKKSPAVKTAPAKAKDPKTAPIVKPQGKSYLPPVPASKNYMQAPYAASYKFMDKANYSLYIPNAFGSDPLANLPGTDGPMLVRIKDNTTYMAVTVIDPMDTVSYKATEPLPKFPNTQLDLTWLMGTKEALKCSAGSYSGFYGDIMVIEASQETKGRTYELLFSFPAKDLYTYLPHVLYSLYTFQVK